MRTSIERLARVVVVVGIFAAGWVGGAITSHDATAQVPSMGDAMKAVEGQGGAIGTAAKLGSTIGEMQSNVENLQKGLDALRTIQKAIGG